MKEMEEYDVALSFAGEDRGFVERVAFFLKDNRIKVFYDKYEQTKLWGKNLIEILDDIYRKKSKYVVVFISKNYAEKVWTKYEIRSALARAIKEKREYVLPARFDNTELIGLHDTIAYIDLTLETPESFAHLIINKLSEKIRGSIAEQDKSVHYGKEAYKLPELLTISSADVEKYERDSDNSKGGMKVSYRFVSKEGEYGDAILAESEVETLGPAPIPAPNRKGSMHALEVLPSAKFAAASWKRNTALIYVVAGAIDIAYSKTKGFYVRIYRWLFLYKASDSTFLLVCVDAVTKITAMIEWLENVDQFGRFDTIENWEIDSIQAIQKVIEQGVIPTGNMVLLRMNDIRGQHIPTWIVPFNAAYIITELNHPLSGCE